MSISDYSKTPGDNNQAAPNGAPENVAPGQINDIIRTDKANQRRQWDDAEWFEYRDGTPDGVAQFVGTNEFRITGNDASAHYHVGRRVKIVGNSIVYATITAVTRTSTTDVTIDETVPNGTLTVYSAILSSSNHSLPKNAIKQIVGEMVAGNTETGISVTYQTDYTLDFEVPDVEWGDVTGKPLNFTPSEHNHDSDYAALNHSHNWASITGKPTTFTPSSHDHNDVYKADFATTVSTSAPSGGEEGDIWYQVD